MVPWIYIENRIGELRSRIDLWLNSIPASLDFTQQIDDGPDRLRYKLILALHFYSARITLGRPCLCRRDAGRKSPTGKTTFIHDMAIITLESAMKVLELIPDEPSPVQLYQFAPWWRLLHYLIQSATVLLLELPFGSIHVPKGGQNFLAQAQESVRWLYAMSAHSVASRRAWQLCDFSLRRLAAGMSYDVSDIPPNTCHPAHTSTLDLNEVNQPDHSVGLASHRMWGPHLEELSFANHLNQPS